MTEKRAHPRKVCDSRIDVMDADSREVVGNLVNISLSGFMMITTHPMSENYVFQFILANSDSEPDQPVIRIGAESLWVQELEGSNQRWVGFQIIDISEEDRERIDEMISNWRE